MLRSTLTLVAVALALSACSVVSGIAPETTEGDPGPGPVATGNEAFITYPPGAAPLGLAPVEIAKYWYAATSEFGFPELAAVGDGTWASVLANNDVRVAVDLGIEESVAAVAQLTIENAATDDEDGLYVDVVIPAFLGAIGLEGVAAELGLDDIETLFEEPRTIETTISGRTVYLAANKWAIVLGVTG